MCYFIVLIFSVLYNILVVKMMKNSNREVLDSIVRLVNYIGEAGIKNILPINDQLDYRIKLIIEKKEGIGSSYGYYDCDLKILCDDQLGLRIQTEAAEESPTDKGHNYITKITVSLLGDEEEEFVVTIYKYRWGYKVLKELDTDTFIELAKQNEENRLCEAPKDFERAGINLEEYSLVINHLAMCIPKMNSELEKEKEEVEKTVQSFTPYQRHILQKVVNEVK